MKNWHQLLSTRIITLLRTEFGSNTVVLPANISDIFPETKSKENYPRIHLRDISINDVGTYGFSLYEGTFVLDIVFIKNFGFGEVRQAQHSIINALTPENFDTPEVRAIYLYISNTTEPTPSGPVTMSSTTFSFQIGG